MNNSNKETPKEQMYHIVFYPDVNTRLVHCLNIEAKSMIFALEIFYRKFPEIEPLYIYNQNK